MAAGVTKKSGKGLRDGVISELTTYWAVQPGHEEELRAAVGRFAELEQAFQEVLDDPAAEEALQHPALKPLLDQAAS